MELQFYRAYRAPENDTARVIFEVKSGKDVDQTLPFDFVVVKMFSSYHQVKKAVDDPESWNPADCVFTVKFWKGDVNRTISCWRTNERFNPDPIVIEFCRERIFAVHTMLCKMRGIPEKLLTAGEFQMG